MKGGITLRKEKLAGTGKRMIVGEPKGKTPGKKKPELPRDASTFTKKKRLCQTGLNPRFEEEGEGVFQCLGMGGKERQGSCLGCARERVWPFP